MDQERHTARALIINPNQEVLLISVKLPWLTSPTWTLPGGGIEAGESAEECARREIFEETGFQYSGELNQHWFGITEFSHQGKSFRVHEQYFLATVSESFTPSMSHMMDYEKDFTVDIAWCGHEQLLKEHCSPRQLHNMLNQVVNQNLPGTIEHLVDVMPDNYVGRQ